MLGFSMDCGLWTTEFNPVCLRACELVSLLSFRYITRLLACEALLVMCSSVLGRPWSQEAVLWDCGGVIHLCWFYKEWYAGLEDRGREEEGHCVLVGGKGRDGE